MRKLQLRIEIDQINGQQAIDGYFCPVSLVPNGARLIKEYLLMSALDSSIGGNPNLELLLLTVERNAVLQRQCELHRFSFLLARSVNACAPQRQPIRFDQRHWLGQQVNGTEAWSFFAGKCQS